MEQESLLLESQTLEELTTMLRGVQEENEHPLDSILGEKTDLASANFMNLYNLAVEEWQQKQKVVSNVCAFAATLINSVGALLEEKQGLEEDLETGKAIRQGLELEMASIRGGQMMKELSKVEKERDQLRESLKIIVNKATLLSNSSQTEVDQIEQYNLFSKSDQIDSSICVSSQGVMTEIENHQIAVNTEEVAKGEQKNTQQVESFEKGINTDDIENPQEKNFREGKRAEGIDIETNTDAEKPPDEKTIFRELSNKVMQLQVINDQLASQKEVSILEMQQQKHELQRQIQELREEVQLSKMEVQLAQIAVQDVLSRSFSQPNNSFIQSNSRAEEQFLNGDLSCFSNMEESILEPAPTMVHTSSTPCFGPNPQIGITQSQMQTSVNAFKKKDSETKQNLELSHHHSEQQFKGLSTTTNIKVNESSMLINNTKTVSLQCNLLKNVPKIKMFLKEKPQLKSKTTIQEEKQAVPYRARPLSQSQIVRPARLNPDPKGSLVKVLNFFSHNMVTKRIRVK